MPRLTALKAGQHWESFFAFVKLQFFRTEDSAVGNGDAPFVAVGIIPGFVDGIVGDDVEDEVLRAVVDDLVGFVGFEDEGVAGLDARGAVLVADGAGAGDDMIEFPLRAMRVIRMSRFAWGNAGDLDVEGVALHQISRLRLAAESFGDLLAGAGVFAFGRGPGLFGESESVDLVHAGTSLKFGVQSSRFANSVPQIRSQPQMGKRIGHEKVQKAQKGK